MLRWLDADHIGFPEAEQAFTSPNGLLAAGGGLSPEWLIHAYQRGIFPWYEDDQPILWWCPDPRMVLFPQELHISRSLSKLLRNNPFKLSIDRDFDAVITACAEPRPRSEGTWITAELKAAYQRLHAIGVAHSVEVWSKENLIGGLYGVALGKVFFGESMFSRSSNSSKLALVFLVHHLRQWGYELIDCQVATEHLASMGAREIPRKEFLARLKELVDGETRPAFWPDRPVE
jgi:leucyl/phenylalanyl-tRNA--protein transferase